MNHQEYRYAQPGDSVSELKSRFITGLSVTVSNPSFAHTIVFDDADRRKHGLPKTMPFASFVLSIVEQGAALIEAMGEDAFYEWLDRFMHASSDERAALWENGGEWE